MKRSPNYILRRASDSIIIVPVGRAAVDFPGMITVNETGAMLWEALAQEQTEAQLTQTLCAAFDAEPSQAAADVAEFLRRLRLAGAIAEENPA